jgi:hypothetical protein
MSLMPGWHAQLFYAHAESNPDHSSGSMPTPERTLGSTMPQPQFSQPAATVCTGAIANVALAVEFCARFGERKVRRKRVFNGLPKARGKAFNVPLIDR